MVAWPMIITLYASAAIRTTFVVDTDARCFTVATSKLCALISVVTGRMKLMVGLGLFWIRLQLSLFSFRKCDSLYFFTNNNLWTLYMTLCQKWCFLHFEKCKLWSRANPKTLENNIVDRQPIASIIWFSSWIYSPVWFDTTVWTDILLTWSEKFTWAVRNYRKSVGKLICFMVLEGCVSFKCPQEHNQWGAKNNPFWGYIWSQNLICLNLLQYFAAGLKIIKY